MGGLGPGIGGLEYLLIAAVALIVVGPERLPGLLRQLGKMIGKARRMADEFRSSFDEMARQSELDDLRKEVEALRTNQSMVRLGDEADAAFKDIRSELDKPADQDAPRSIMALDPEPGSTAAPVDEWPDTHPVMRQIEPVVQAMPQAKPKPVRKSASKSTNAEPSSPKARPARERAPRKAKLQP